MPHSVFYQIFLKEELAAVNMNLKTQIKIYQKLVSELGGKFEGAKDFIKSRLMELCSEQGRYVCIYILFYSTYTV